MRCVCMEKTMKTTALFSLLLAACVCQTAGANTAAGYKDVLIRDVPHVKQKPDFILIGASGSITMQSPDIVQHMQMPTFIEISRMCKEAGVPCEVHSCGRERILVDMLGEGTDVTMVNPLEDPPTGDCDLAEVKKAWGHKLAMMGNLNTPELMLRGSVEEVEEASKKAIDDAGDDGGFILSTGDQIGRDTPYENIHAMVRIARSYGKY